MSGEFENNIMGISVVNVSVATNRWPMGKYGRVLIGFKGLEVNEKGNEYAPHFFSYFISFSYLFSLTLF